MIKDLIGMDEHWYKKVTSNETWIKKSKNKRYFDSLKIISVLNLKNKKRVKVEFPSGKRTSVEPGWLFYNYKKQF